MFADLPPPDKQLLWEQGAFLTKVAVSAMLEVQDKRQQEEAEERTDLARIAVETMREMFADLPPPNNLLPWELVQCRARGCNASPCLTE